MLPEKCFDTQNSIITEIIDPILDSHRVKLFVKRDDLIHDEVSGNKWRKLKYNILKCLSLKNEGILTFGGAYSNHLVATASACKTLGLKCVGIVRGDELNERSNAALEKCHELGMKLVFVSRSEYQLRNEKIYKDDLSMQYPNYWIVPEGGANYYGYIGCQEVMAELSELDFDEIFVAQGTSTTSVGLLLSKPEFCRLNVVPVLKGYDSIGEMKALLIKGGYERDFIGDLLEAVEVSAEFHFGGYGKHDQRLLNFIRTFYQKHKVKLDPVYTGKVMFSIYERIERGEFDDSRIVFIHTGGIQGSKSIEEKTGFELYPAD